MSKSYSDGYSNAIAAKLTVPFGSENSSGENGTHHSYWTMGLQQWYIHQTNDKKLQYDKHCYW